MVVYINYKMPRQLQVNNFSSAWKHYRDNVISYICDSGIIEFRYEDSHGGDIINVVINYIETTDEESVHQLIKDIIADLPIEQSIPTNALTTFGSIIFKNNSNAIDDFKLRDFQYAGYRFVVQGEDCVMVSCNET